jgi:hypothetical protein
LVRVATFYTAANAFITPDGSITSNKLEPGLYQLITNAANSANYANSSIITIQSTANATLNVVQQSANDTLNVVIATAATTGKAIAMSIVFGG